MGILSCELRKWEERLEAVKDLKYHFYLSAYDHLSEGNAVRYLLNVAGGTFVYLVGEVVIQKKCDKLEQSIKDWPF